LGEGSEFENVVVSKDTDGTNTVLPQRGEYPFTASVKRFLYVPSRFSDYSSSLIVGDPNFRKLNPMEFSGALMRRALGNTMDFYRPYGPQYMANHNDLDQLATQFDPDDTAFPVTNNLIDVPKIFYGDSLRKGSVRLKYYISGTKIAEAHDLYHNGDLIQISGNQAATVPLSSTVGVVLYNEGIIILSGSSDPKRTGYKLSENDDNKDFYKRVAGDAGGGVGGSGSHITDWPQWQYFFNGVGPDRTFLQSAGPMQAEISSYQLEFEGVHEVPALTMFAHAPKTHLNHSNNPTYLAFSQSLYPTSTNIYAFQQNEVARIQNTVSSSFHNVSGTFQKQTFISNVAIFDKDRNLIGVAKVGTPVRKTEEQDYTFKLTLDT